MVVGPSPVLFAGTRAKALVYARQIALTAPTRTHASVLGASACGIRASTPLSVLDHDRAYICLDACTVYRAPAYCLTFKPDPPGVRFLSKVNYLGVCRTLYNAPGVSHEDRPSNRRIKILQEFD